jgi:hypothetical protein
MEDTRGFAGEQAYGVLLNVFKAVLPGWVKTLSSALKIGSFTLSKAKIDPLANSHAAAERW